MMDLLKFLIKMGFFNQSVLFIFHGSRSKLIKLKYKKN
jgi:hypothetical protein